MAKTGRRDTRAELNLRREIYAQGMRYRVDRRVLTNVRRRADIVFTGPRIAVFVDGCFWHGCPEHGTWPTANAAFWREKIQANQQRDIDTNTRLVEAGWTVIRVWEHEDPVAAAQRIRAAVELGRNS